MNATKIEVPFNVAWPEHPAMKNALKWSLGSNQPGTFLKWSNGSLVTCERACADLLRSCFGHIRVKSYTAREIDEKLRSCTDMLSRKGVEA